MSPYSRKSFGEVEHILADPSKWNFVVEVDSENARVIVCSVCEVSVFPARVVAECSEFLSQAFEKALEMWLVEAAPLGQMFIVVGESDETVFSMKLRFVCAPYRPLS